MKIFKYIIILMVLLFTTQAKANQKCVKDMITQITDINNSWKPIVGTSVYVIKKHEETVIVLRLYDKDKTDSDPSNIDLQGVFMKKGNECILRAITFSPIDLTKYINLIIE